ncbi:MAG: hypothetical protein Q6351_008155 [Candidatus Njordarchaeum guaymaensis]
MTIKCGVRVNLAFTNRNWVTGKTHIDSALQTLKKGLSALLEIFKAVARIIAKVVSMLLEVIKKIILKMLEPILKPLKDAKESLFKEIFEFLSIEQTIDSSRENGDNDGLINIIPIFSIIQNSRCINILSIISMGIWTVLLVAIGLLTVTTPGVNGIGAIIKNTLSRALEVDPNLYVGVILPSVVSGLAALLGAFIGRVLGDVADEHPTLKRYIDDSIYLSSAIVSVIEIIKCRSIRSLPIDAIGLLLSFIGVTFFTSESSKKGNILERFFLRYKAIFDFLAYLFISAGFLIAIQPFKPDPLDQTGNPIAFIDDFLTGVCFGYGISQS